MPGKLLGQKTAQKRAEDGRKSQDGTHNSLCLATIAFAQNIGHYGHGNDDQPPASQTLDEAPEDQHPHAAGQTADSRAGKKDENTGLKNGLAPVKIGQLARNRRADRGGEQIDRHDPGDAFDGPQIGDDNGNGRGNARLAERREQQDAGRRKNDQSDRLAGTCRLGRCGS